jgi:uncharacterized protein YndB with AHSA1/START domain
MHTNTVRLCRIFRATPETIYNAFLDSDAMPKWLPPNGFTAKVHKMDAKVSGTYKMPFTNSTTRKSHSFGWTYIELTPHERIRYTDKFDDSNLPGEMQTTMTLTKVSCGSDLNIAQEGGPQRDRCWGMLSRLTGIASSAGETSRARDSRLKRACLHHSITVLAQVRPPPNTTIRT